MEINAILVKPPLNQFSGGLLNCGLTSLVKQATDIISLSSRRLLRSHGL